jgi:hypothetical protein
MDQPFGGFTEEALAAYQKAVAEKEGVEFSEGGTYDFTTCIRPDGSAYGTGGKCRKGTEGEAKKDSKAGKSGSGGFDMDKAKKERTDLAGDIVDLALKGSTKPEDMEKLRALKARALELDKQIIAGGGKMEGRVQNQANQARHRMAGTTKKVLDKAKSRDAKVEKARAKVEEAKASGDKKKLASARHNLQIEERTRKIEEKAKKEGKTFQQVADERNAAADKKIKDRIRAQYPNMFSPAKKSEGGTPVAPAPPKSAMKSKDPVASALKAQKQLSDLNKQENARVAGLVRAGKVKGVDSGAIDRIRRAKLQDAASKGDPKAIKKLKEMDKK